MHTLLPPRKLAAALAGITGTAAFVINILVIALNHPRRQPSSSASTTATPIGHRHARPVPSPSRPQPSSSASLQPTAAIGMLSARAITLAGTAASTILTPYYSQIAAIGMLSARAITLAGTAASTILVGLYDSQPPRSACSARAITLALSVGDLYYTLAGTAASTILVGLYYSQIDAIGRLSAPVPSPSRAPPSTTANWTRSAGSRRCTSPPTAGRMPDEWRSSRLRQYQNAPGSMGNTTAATGKNSASIPLLAARDRRAVGGSSASTRSTRPTSRLHADHCGFIIPKDLPGACIGSFLTGVPWRHTAWDTPRRSPNVRDEARIVGSPASTKPTRRKVAAEAVVTERRWISMAGQSNTLIQMHRMADQSNTRVTGARRQTNSADASLHPGLPLDGLGGDL